jgi:aspartate ammonia-lyase
MRKESDVLGECEIPNDAYFGIQSYRAYKNFPVSGTQLHPLMNYCYLLLKKAAAIANQKTRSLDKKKSIAIITAVDQLIKMDLANENDRYFIVDAYGAGAGTSQNMNVNEVIANKANEILGHKLGSYQEINPNDHVNMSQSTNDSFPTALRLANLLLSTELLSELMLFSAALENKSIEFDHILKAARTHLQDAVPIRLGQEFKAYQFTIDKLIILIKDAQSSLRELAIGGSAVGTGINVPAGYREFIIDELKIIFNDQNLILSENLIASTQSQLSLMIYSNSLRALALELTRIFNDLRLLSSGPSTGLSELSLPASQLGSSIMPGKMNPSFLEMGNQVCFKVIGNDVAMSFAMQAGQLELNVMMPLMAQLTLESGEILKNAIRLIRMKCIEGIEANEKQCKKYLDLTTQIATILNPIIGYEKTSKLVKEALHQNKSFIDLIREKKILSPEKFELLLNLRSMTVPK